MIILPATCRGVRMPVQPDIVMGGAQMWVRSFIALVGLVSCPGAFAQTPPPPPQVWNAQLAFFSALPQRLPAKDLSAFERLVADDVQVFRDGKLVHADRQHWIAEIQSYRQRTPNDPQGFSVSRDQFALLRDGGISVREFTYPIAPDGETIFYHPSYPLRYVTYRIRGEKLVRVDYGPPMEHYNGLCQAVETTRGTSAEGISTSCK